MAAYCRLQYCGVLYEYYTCHIILFSSLNSLGNYFERLLTVLPALAFRDLAVECRFKISAYDLESRQTATPTRIRNDPKTAFRGFSISSLTMKKLVIMENTRASPLQMGTARERSDSERAK